MLWQPTRGLLQPNQAWRRPQAVAAGGDVTIDVIGTTGFAHNSTGFNYTGLTITAGLTNPALVCWLLRSGGTPPDVQAGVSLSWGAQALALISILGTDTDRTAFLYGLRNPTSGNQTLSFSATNPTSDTFINCVSFYNVNQTSNAAAFQNPVTSEHVSSTVTVTSAPGHIVAAAFCGGAGNGAIIGTTVINDGVNGNIIYAGGGAVVSTGTSTIAGTVGPNQSSLAAVDISN